MTKGWIAKGEVEEYKLFTEEPKAKRDKRHKKYAKEAREAATIKREMERKNKHNDTLEQQIMKRQSDRSAIANNFFDRLLEKYGDADDSEEYVIPKKRKSTSTKRVTTKNAAKSNPKAPIHKTRYGRVTKTK